MTDARSKLIDQLSKTRNRLERELNAVNAQLKLAQDESTKLFDVSFKQLVNHTVTVAVHDEDDALIAAEEMPEQLVEADDGSWDIHDPYVEETF